jgi:hypothetical protein
MARGLARRQPTASCLRSRRIARRETQVLSVDDGTPENGLGLTAGGQFLWLNRFTPTADELPFQMNAVDVLFDTGVGVNPGRPRRYYVYEDTDGDGDPGTNAVLRAQINDAAVQFTDGVTFSTFPLDTVQEFTEGDVIVAVVNRTAGVAAGQFPAALDETEPQGRSWIGLYSADPPDPPPLPADDTFRNHRRHRILPATG